MSEFKRIGQLKKSKKGSLYLEFNPKIEGSLGKMLQKLGPIFISKFDAEFREKYEIPDYILGGASIKIDNESEEREEKPKKESKKLEESDDFDF